MERGKSRLRLDEVLVREGLVSEAQIKEALLRQKAHGGKFGSQLLYHRYIDEAGLVKALATQMGCEGVVLGRLDIPPEIVKLIPKKVAIARKVIAFDYDPDSNLLKIACEDPIDQSLINELNFVARGKEIKLYAAAELALNTAIARHYLGREVSLEESLLLEIPDEATETVEPSQAADEHPAADSDDQRRAVLLVTDEEYAGPLLQSILERDGYRVTVADSADDAIDLSGDQKFAFVFIKDTVAGDYIDLIDRLRKSSPGTTVRYYESASGLVLNRDAGAAEGQVLLSSLDLYTSLLSSLSGLSGNHAGRVGQYVDRLCRKIGLPDKDRLLVISAAYVHEVAGFYYHMAHADEYRRIIALSARLLESLSYTPVIVEMLRGMYIDLKGRYTKRLPIEVLGGNIITIVDIFCNNIPSHERLSLDKFDAIRRKLRDLTGKLFLAEVVEPFIMMIQEDILKQQATGRTGQVMIFTADTDAARVLEQRLKWEGFRTVAERSLDAFVDLFRRGRPDLVILVLPGTPNEAANTVSAMAARSIDWRTVPTFILSDSSAVAELTHLLDNGIEDVVSVEDNFDILMVKLRHIRDRINSTEEGSDTKETPGGSTGRLSDMNLIDLLQALGPSRKTVRITTCQSGSPQDKLIIYLRQGDVVAAQYANRVGPEPIY
ncbi:MAG TPA: DUF4388 domain-containing protein, partial [Candidatus Deferrimicrobium sp.]|nr:DUF4388 domain-containing protein [Candidatus Deferrimicrobium sp.]